MPDKWTEQKIGVFLIAESPVARQGALSVISQQDDIEVVGQAGSADEPFSITGNITPRTVVLRAIPPRGSFEMIGRLREISPEISVIVLAEYEDDDGLFQAIMAGAYAFLTKETTPEQLLVAIRRVANGERLLGENILNRPRIALWILERFRELSSMTNEFELLVAPLSPSEHHVLHLIATGNPVEAIVNSLNVSKQVIATRVASALRKLDVNERCVTKADRVGVSIRDKKQEEVTGVLQVAQEEAASMVANARYEMEQLLVKSEERLEAEVKKQRFAQVTEEDREYTEIYNPTTYTTWYQFKQDLEKQSGGSLLNSDWLEVKPDAPLPWNDSHLKAALSAVVRIRRKENHF